MAGMGSLRLPGALVRKAMTSVCCYLVLQLSGQEREDPELPAFLCAFVSCTGLRLAPQLTPRSLKFPPPSPVL